MDHDLTWERPGYLLDIVLWLGIVGAHFPLIMGLGELTAGRMEIGGALVGAGIGTLCLNAAVLGARSSARASIDELMRLGLKVSELEQRLAPQSGEHPEAGEVPKPQGV